MRKAAKLAAAFAVLATSACHEQPAFAQDADCTKIDDNNYGLVTMAAGVVIAERIDLAKATVCLGVFVPQGALSASPSPDKPFCFDLNGAADQVMRPVIVSTDGIAHPQIPNDLDDAKAQFYKIVEMCDAQEPKGQMVNFKPLALGHK